MNYVYILECSDKTYYTGWTTDPLRRLQEHNSGYGSKYVRSRRPAQLIYCHEYLDKRDAMREEWRIKHQLSKHDKKELIQSDNNQLFKLIGGTSNDQNQ